MEPQVAVELARMTLFTALKMAAPLLVSVLCVSLMIAILQTITNLQEQTLTIVPKVVTALLMTIVLVPWFIQHLLDFAVPLLRDVLPQRM